MEISCERVWQEVSNYLEGEVDPALRAVIEEHCRGCRRCTAVLDGSRNVLQVVGDGRAFELPLGFERRLRMRLEESMPRPEKHWMRWMVFATAAAVLVVLFQVGSGTAFREAPLRSGLSHPGTDVPAELMVVVAASGKTFHVAGCKFLHDKTSLRTIPASEAIREGYSPCVRCMRDYLSAEAVPAPAGHEPFRVAFRDDSN